MKYQLSGVSSLTTVPDVALQNISLESKANEGSHTE